MYLWRAEKGVLLLKASRPEPEWDRGMRRGGWTRGNGGVCVGVQGPPAAQAKAEAAVKGGPVFFPRPARRETLLQLARVKSHR